MPRNAKKCLGDHTGNGKDLNLYRVELQNNVKTQLFTLYVGMLNKHLGQKKKYQHIHRHSPRGGDATEEQKKGAWPAFPAGVRSALPAGLVRCTLDRVAVSRLD